MHPILCLYLPCICIVLVLNFQIRLAFQTPEEAHCTAFAFYLMHLLLLLPPLQPPKLMSRLLCPIRKEESSPILHHNFRCYKFFHKQKGETCTRRLPFLIFYIYYPKSLSLAISILKGSVPSPMTHPKMSPRTPSQVPQLRKSVRKPDYQTTH